MSDLDNIPFCGQHDAGYAIGGRTYQWPKGSHLTWTLTFSRLGTIDAEQLKQAITEALLEISTCCNVTHEYTKSRVANIVITLQRLDGQSGTLADCQIPVGNIDQSTQLLMRIDDSEQWGLFANPPANKIDFYRVVLHELLHAHGLGHKPDNVAGPALIAPMYSRTLRNLQAADKAELVRRYGPPKSVTPAQPAPTSGNLTVESLVIVDAEGRRYKLSGTTGPLAMVQEE